MKLAKEFVKFVVKELGLKSLPKNIKFEGDDYSAQHLTFGTYQPDTDEIVIVKGDRHPIDVLRTLAHELVHHAQRQSGQSLDGSDGSNTENEANAKAGELMRKFRTQRPEIFTKQTKVDSIHEVIRTNRPRQIDNQYIDAFTARLLITTMNNLSDKNRIRFMNESVERMVAIAYKMVTW